MSTLPTWALYVIGLGTPLSAFVAVLLGHFVTRRGATELDKRAKREEVGRTLRWAAEQAVKTDDPGANSLGTAVLLSLQEADKTLKNLQPEDKLLLGAVVEAVAGSSAAAYRELTARGAQPEAVIDDAAPPQDDRGEADDEEGDTG